MSDKKYSTDEYARITEPIHLTDMEDMINDETNKTAQYLQDNNVPFALFYLLPNKGTVSNVLFFLGGEAAANGNFSALMDSINSFIRSTTNNEYSIQPTPQDE